MILVGFSTNTLMNAIAPMMNCVVRQRNEYGEGALFKTGITFRKMIPNLWEKVKVDDTGKILVISRMIKNNNEAI